MTRRMDEIDHTHPYTGETFGANGGVFTRGPVAADGGTAGDAMDAVDHVAPDGEGASEVWDRGPGDSPGDTEPTDEVNPSDAVQVDDE